MSTLKIVPRDLVSRWYGDRAFDQDALHDAVVQMMHQGWLPSFVPQQSESDRTMVFLPQRDKNAFVRYLDIRGHGVVPRGLIESRTQLPLASIGTGLMLSDLGIAIVRVDGNNVHIQSTMPGLALIANSCRNHPMEGMPTARLVTAATGLQLPVQRWNDDLLLRVAITFDELQLDLPGLLDGQNESNVESRWLFARTPPTASNGNPDLPPF